MGQGFLVDTCVIVKYLNEALSDEWLSHLDDLLDSTPNISFITEIELLVWKSGTEEEMDKRKIVVGELSKIYINQDIIDKTIYVRKSTNIKLPDAVIAATALTDNLTLISTNHKDFNKVTSLGLRYINPETDTASNVTV